MRAAHRNRWSGRDVDQEHRVSTPLELFFDLTFAVSLAAVAAEISHILAEGEVFRPVAVIRHFHACNLLGVDELFLIRIRLPQVIDEVCPSKPLNIMPEYQLCLYL